MTFFRTHSKKFMAFFGVILMLAFVMPSTFSNSNNTAALVGKIGDEKITRDEVAAAEQGWSVVSQRVQFRRRDQRSGQEQWVPLLALLPISQQAYEQMRNDPTSYYLLQAEAKKLGILPSQEDARQLLNQQEVGIATANGARVDFTNAGDDNTKNALLYHVANFLTIAQSFQRATDAAKISKPLVHAQLMEQFQKVQSYVVDISAKQFETSVPPPTTQQVQQQFDQFGDSEPGAISTQNPFGFGYKYPNRVKVQYILVPLSQCTVAVRSSKSDYDWEVDAFKYYDKHQYEYPTTQPGSTASAVKDFVSTRPTSQASGPTTKPFEEVKSQIVESLVQPAAAKLQRQIVSDIQSKMESDFAQKVDIGKFDYLQKLAADITSKHKVAPTIVAINDSFKSAAELRLLPNIGRVPSFPDFATFAIEPFLPADQRGKPNVMALNQPSKPVEDGADNVYIYQVTAADPAHKPASIDEVRDQVAKDFVKAQAMDQAKKQADQLLAAAQKSGLKPAAEAINQKVILTGSYPRSANVPISDYPLAARAQAEFVNKTYSLIGKIKDPSATKPVTLVELPSEEKIAVAELVAVDSALPADSMEMFDSFVASQMMQQYQQIIAQDWFQHEAILTRTKFEPINGPSKPAAPAEPVAPAPAPLGS